jgi:hypothetical protein
MKEKKTGELVFSAVWSGIFLIAVNAAPWWQPFTHGVVLPSFMAVLWAFNLSGIAQLAGNVSLVFYRPAPFNAVVQLLTTLTALTSSIALFTVFPLDFGAIGLAWINSVLRIVFIVGMCGAGIGAIFQTVQLCTRRGRLEYSVR